MRRCVILALVLTSITTSRAKADCVFRPEPGPLNTAPGFMDFIHPDRLQLFKRHLPTTDDARLQQLINATTTMWYDEASMVFAYQDSQESVVGARANCVGRDVGERNRDNSAIAKLMNFFGTDYRFRFPFRMAAGTDDTTNTHAINFWAPPRASGRVLPVKWWRESSRGRWHWLFPVGTVIGEILYQQATDGEWYPFEVRTRIRYRDGWAVQAYRPYRTARELAEKIQTLEPAWASIPALAQTVAHLETDTNLTPVRLESPAFAKVFNPIDGALDLIPDMQSEALVKRLLAEPFRSTEGYIWKEGRGLETYAPASLGRFSVVPAGYKMGPIAANEVSCNRCHIETGRPLVIFDSDIVLYGEVWGEDRIFTWHLFEPWSHIFSTWDDADGSRRINPRMVQAGLVAEGQPSPNDPLYHSLPTPF